MIFNHHLLLNKLLNKTMCIDFDSKSFDAKYYEADLLELNKVLATSETKYPLIWLETGYKEEHRLQGSELKLTNCNFIFITKGDKTDYFAKRYATSFNSILYPLLAKFENKINSTLGISFEKEYHEVISLPFNNVSELSAKSRKPESQGINITDIWDALILTTDLSINPNCFPELIIKK